MAAVTQVTPEVLWAQRSSATDATKNYIYLTISVPDVPKSSMKLDLKSTGLTFTGHSDTLKRTYHVELEFYDEIDQAESKVNHTMRDIELVLRKKELKEAYWPRLLKEARKVHFLKTDFDKWVDEDEQDEAPDDLDMNQFGGAGAGGMGGMGGEDFGGIDFSKLGGGMGGMPGMEGMGGMGDMGDMEGEEEEEDEDMEEGDEEEAATGATGASATKTATTPPKIEEVA